MSELEDLAFDQAVRLIEHQRHAMTAVRERVGSLVAGASIATSFLGSTALQEGEEPSGWAWLAIVLFVLTIGGSIFVLWARTGWEFGLDPPEILRRGADSDIGDVKRELTGWMEGHYDRNADKLDTIIWVFNLSALGLGLEVGAWLAAIVWG
jgi:hypothetical protein